MTLSGKLKLVQALLVSVAPDITHHYRRPSDLKRFIVWQEDAEDTSFHANNETCEIGLTGSIDLYTQTEYDQLIDDLQEAFSASTRVTSRLESVMYDDDAGLIHYTWTFWVM